MSTHPRPTNTADLKHYIDGMAKSVWNQGNTCR